MFFFVQFLTNPEHDVETVVNTDRQQQHGDGIHGCVERHVHAGKLQPSGEAVGGSDRNNGEDQDVGGFPNTAEVEPQNDAQQEHRGTGEHADFLADGGAGILGELGERKGAQLAVVGGRHDLEFHRFRPSRQIGLHVAEDVVTVVQRLA